jgi:hypothetical protein
MSMSFLDHISRMLHSRLAASSAADAGASTRGDQQPSLETLHERALDTSSLFADSDTSIQAIDELTRLGDFSILPELEAKRDSLLWEGPIGDGIEHIAYMFQAYREAVERMAARRNASARTDSSTGHTAP